MNEDLEEKLKEELKEEGGGEIRKPQEMAEPLSSVRQLGGERRLVTRGPKGHHAVELHHTTLYNTGICTTQCTMHGICTMHHTVELHHTITDTKNNIIINITNTIITINTNFTLT